MSEWKEIKIGDIGNVVTGKTPSKNNKEDWGNEMLFITPSDYGSYGKKAYKSVRNLSMEGVKRFSNKILPPNSILVTCIGSDMGKVVMNGVRAVTNQQINSIIPNSDIVNHNFGYYLLVELYETLKIYGGDGTAVPIVNKSDFENIKIVIPPLPEQKAIAEVLSSLDEKIELLYRQNQTLEQMAETLFRQWFVEEAEEGWEEITLFEAIQLMGGGTPKTSIEKYWNGSIKWLSGGDIATNHKSIITSSEKTITEEGLKKSSAKLLPEFATVISARGTVGKYCILSEPMAFSQSNYGILPKYENCYFFTYLLINHSVEELNSAAYGSVFDTITTNTFKGMNIEIPSESEIQEFENKVSPYFLKILNNQIQIRSLTALRDTLLPKLMSGEVRITTY